MNVYVVELKLPILQKFSRQHCSHIIKSNALDEQSLSFPKILAFYIYWAKFLPQ